MSKRCFLFFLLFSFSSLLIRCRPSFRLIYSCELDPLIALTTMLASRAIHAALFLSLVLVAATLLFGRFFCGWVCPLGTLIDFSKNIFPRRKTVPAENPSLSHVKYYLLVLILTGCVLGFNLAGWLDPIAFITRVYTLLLYPFVFLLLNSGLDALRPLAVKLQLVTLSHQQFMQPLFYLNVLTLFIFSGVLFLNYFAERFWCRNSLPAGRALKRIFPLGDVQAAGERCLQPLHEVPSRVPHGSDPEGAGRDCRRGVHPVPALLTYLPAVCHLLQTGCCTCRIYRRT